MDKIIRTALFFNLILTISSQVTQNLGRPAYDINEQIKSFVFNTPTSLKVKDESLENRFKNFFNENLPRDDKLNTFENATKCLRDVSYIATNLKSNWALRMLDSFGKLESGILIGNVKMLGEYTECMDVYAPPANNESSPATGDFHGQYCTLTIQSDFLFMVGVCIPDSCTSEIQDLYKILNPIDETNSTSNGSMPIQSDCKPRERQLNGPAISVIFLMSLFSTLVILGSSITVVKYFLTTTGSRKNSLIINIPHNDLGGDSNDPFKRNVQDKDDDLLLQDRTAASKFKAFKKIEPFFECFCLFKNGAKLLNTDTSEGELLCIHGIRFLSMSWVILGHMYSFVFAETRNTLEIFKLLQPFPFQIVLQGLFSVDSFFVLSGFLMTYLCMQQLAKSQGYLNWPYFYIHRYLRLTPMYMIILGFWASVFLYLGSGPFWSSSDVDANCHKHWWYNILYINNFLSLSDQCMGWSWYLANDMQFFIISPIILVLLWRWPVLGYSFVTLLLSSCFVANFYITYHYELLPGFAGILSSPDPYANPLQLAAKQASYMDKLYVRPYTRIAPYLVGMLLGYLMYIRKKNNSSKHSPAFLAIGWIIATEVTLATVYGLYNHNVTLIASCFYNALSRMIWGLGLSWVIYVCLMDQGGFVNSILSYKLFIPLSRLTYAAYLIHPMIITGYYLNLKTAFEFSHPTLVLLYLGVTVVTYALALPVSLVLESPLINLEKLVRKSFTKQD